MEIKDFKIRVTPEQTLVVQQTLFNNGYSWSGDKTFFPWFTPHLYLLKGNIMFDLPSQVEEFDRMDLPELTFEKFLELYGTNTVEYKLEEYI